MSSEHVHDWVPLGNLEVCRVGGCDAHRAVTEEADAALEHLGDLAREPMRTERIYVFSDPAYTDTEFMVVVYADGQAEISSRMEGDAWGPPALMERRNHR